tara:strand:- start:639 stop:761 length:123 start_codon:yes stop_codon:yes gene_type:complete
MGVKDPMDSQSKKMRACIVFVDNLLISTKKTTAIGKEIPP